MGKDRNGHWAALVRTHGRRHGHSPGVHMQSDRFRTFFFTAPAVQSITNTVMRHFLWVGLLATASLAYAQQPAPAAPVTTTHAPAASMPKTPKVAVPYKAGAPEQRAEKMSQQLGKQLGLDAATVAKVKAAALVRDQQIDIIQTSTDSNKAKNTALQANAQAFKAALKGILTPEQFAKYSTHGAKTPVK